MQRDGLPQAHTRSVHPRRPKRTLASPRRSPSPLLRAAPTSPRDRRDPHRSKRCPRTTTRRATVSALGRQRGQNLASCNPREPGAEARHGQHAEQSAGAGARVFGHEESNREGWQDGRTRSGFFRREDIHVEVWDQSLRFAGENSTGAEEAAERASKHSLISSLVMIPCYLVLFLHTPPFFS